MEILSCFLLFFYCNSLDCEFRLFIFPMGHDYMDYFDYIGLYSL